MWFPSRYVLKRRVENFSKNFAIFKMVHIFEMVLVHIFKSINLTFLVNHLPFVVYQFALHLAKIRHQDIDIYLLFHCIQ